MSVGVSEKRSRRSALILFFGNRRIWILEPVERADYVSSQVLQTKNVFPPSHHRLS